MAKQKKGNGAKKPGPAKKGKGSESAPTSGHNIRITKKSMGEFSLRFNRLMDERDKYTEDHKDDMDALMGEGADAHGVSKADFRKALKEQRAEKKRMAKEAEMDPERLQNLDKMRDALGLFGDTPLGAAAIATAEKKGADPKVVELKPAAG